MTAQGSQFSKKLINWYRNHARDLPWRRTRDPYKIWISEIMLQQTQVETVIPYYERWIKRFPTIHKLAKAPLSEVFKLWAGLGYYRRAENLHRAARLLVKENGGCLPNSVESLRKLPGIGRYTAGAIASIAYQKPVPLLDGNVIRVLTRIYGIAKDIGSSETINELWKLAETLVPKKAPGDFNQALMELGATLCSPMNPKCRECPVNSLCTAFRQKRPEKFPVTRDVEKMVEKTTAALVLRQNGKVYVEKQPAGGRWGNLWMFPHWENRSLMLNSGIKRSQIKPLMSLRHGFTKYRITLHVFQMQADKFKKNAKSTVKGKWVTIQKLAKYPFPSPHKKIVTKLQAESI